MRIIAILAVGCALALTQAAKANPFDFDNYFNPGTGTGTPEPVAAIFGFTPTADPGDPEGPGALLGDFSYNPATQTVTDILLQIQLTTTATSLQNVQVNLDGVILNTSFIGGITFGGTLSPVDRAAIVAAAQDGAVAYSISGDTFNVNFARMDLVTEPKGVPDVGSSLALFGLALGGIGVARRRFCS